MNANTLKQRLINSPHLNHITFNKEKHEYLVRGVKYEGFTSITKKYAKPFEKDKMSKFVSMRDGVSQEEVLDAWAVTNKKAIDYGSEFHDVVDEFVKTGEINPVFETELNYVTESLNDLGLEPLLGEYLVFNDDMKRASSIDLICMDKNTGKLVVLDYKTPEKGIKFEGYKNQRLLYPLNKLEDCSYVTYSFQVSLYIKELAKLGFDVDHTGYLLYIRPNESAIYPTLQLFGEVNSIIQMESFNK